MTAAERPAERADEPARPDAPKVPTGRIALGTVLVLAGTAWLLEMLDVVDVPWDKVLPVVLVACGVALVALGVTGRSSGVLLAVGITLTIVLLVTTIVNIPVLGGVGERTERPRTAAELDAYELAIGSLRVDLTALDPGDRVTELEARVGVGELVVVVPAGVVVAGRGRAGAGEVVILGEQHSGVGVDRTFEAGTGTGRVEVDLSVGLGSVRVER